MSPEASGSLKEADSQCAGAHEPAAALDEVGDDDSAEARWSAIVAAHEAGDGPWLTFKGQDLRGEWLEKTRGEDARVVRVNLAQWRPNLPSSYAERRQQEVERGAAADRERRQAELDRTRREAEQHERAALATMTDETLRSALPRLVLWLKSGTPQSRQVAQAIAYEGLLRSALDLVRSGNPYGVKRLLALLLPPERRLLVAALTEITTVAPAAAIA